MKTNRTDTIYKNSILKTAFIIFCAVLLYTVPSTFFLDFIRDTEADRTLISMEMARGSSWTVPHLLGQEFLTKPPAFYWAQALSIIATGSEKEWAARLPSAVATAIMVMAIYLFIKIEGDKSQIKPDLTVNKKAITTAAILATTGAIFRLSIAAEIDMMFTMLITLSLLGGYYTVTTSSIKYKIMAALAFQLFAALAFLTKGPPVFLFSWLPVIIFFIVYSISKNNTDKTKKTFKQSLFHFTCANVTGLLLFSAITGAWINAVINELGSEKVIDHWNYQVVDRVTGKDGEHTQSGRGALFYIKAIGKGSIPWTPFLILALFQWYRKKANLNYKKQELNEKNENPANLPFIFALVVIIPSLIGLTIPAGKASRYMLPLWPFFAIIISEAISKWNTTESKKDKIITGIVITIILLRIPWCFGYARIRNEKKSPRPMAASISELVPKGQNIYILMLMERWICYYLITSENKTVLRLNTEIVDKWQSDDSSSNPVFILMSNHNKTPRDNETWKIDKLTGYDEDTTILKKYTQNKRHFQLIKTSKRAIKKCKLTKDFFCRK